jgi:hypothetical protein
MQKEVLEKENGLARLEPHGALVSHLKLTKNHHDGTVQGLDLKLEPPLGNIGRMIPVYCLEDLKIILPKKIVVQVL